MVLGLVVWIFGISYERDCYLGIPRMPNHQPKPQTNNCPLVESINIHVLVCVETKDQDTCVCVCVIDDVTDFKLLMPQLGVESNHFHLGILGASFFVFKERALTQYLERQVSNFF